MSLFDKIRALFQGKARGDPDEWTVPFRPETLEALQARYHLALEDAFEEELIRLGTQSVPGGDPRNLFDFDDGLRLIVTRDIAMCGCQKLTVSGWATPRGPHYFDPASLTMNEIGRKCMAFAGVVAERFHRLSGDDREVELRMMQPGQCWAVVEVSRCQANRDDDEEEIEFVVTRP